ncbi:hypothetical protein [Hymenobacter guriensis]|uniref:Outer membrane protein beta-barrel domain-containing protein n=1 Tax=Hymenobacter guriensis TaxID=2793065 RepID=A0ABS0L5N5_9BACT|nr:hypothetical protein [Hymenobacter guriensis]MBG8555409.1 hypothetical protein [Hymenobacter guriensis]
MKTLLTSLSLLASTAAFAQQAEQPALQTLLRPGTHCGFFVAASAQYARLAGQDALAVTGRLGVSFNRSFALGLGGTALTNGRLPNRWNDPADTPADYLAAAYGGIYLEPMFPAGKAIHLTFPVLLGAGAATREGSLNGPYYRYQADEFLLVEPGVQLEVNLLRFVALGAGASYRMTTGLNLPDTSSKALNGMSAGVTLKLGLL